MSIVAVHHRNTTNLGDLVCSPAQYFDFGDVTFVDVHEQLPEAEAYLFGGGAMYNRAIRAEVPGIKIAWGLGQTNRGKLKTEGRAPSDFALFGSRDVGQDGAEWVPCASCMSPLFDKQYDIKHDVVGYWNFYPDKTVPRPRISGIPTEVNRCSFERAIEFLGSGQKILTNSYHGAFWGTLLGREVVIINPYSSKFYGLKHQPQRASQDTWQGVRSRLFPEALAECRQATLNFHDKVRNVLC